MNQRRSKVPASAWQRLIESTPDEGVQPMANAKIIDTAQLHGDPRQPRKTFEERAMRELIDSVRERGILQPITVQRDPNGGYFVVTGERRLRAAQEVGLAQVPVLVVDLSEPELRLDRVIENRQRKGLTDSEFALALRDIREDLGARAPNLTSNELDEFVGKHVGIAGRTVRSFNALLNVSPEVSELLGGMLTELRMRGLSRLGYDPALQLELAQAVLEHDLSGRQTVAAATMLKRNPGWTVAQAVAAARGQQVNLAEDEPAGSEQRQARYWSLTTNLARAAQTLEQELESVGDEPLTSEQVVDLYRLLSPFAELTARLQPAFEYLEQSGGVGDADSSGELPAELRVSLARLSNRANGAANRAARKGNRG